MAMVFELAQAGEKRWRKLNGNALLARGGPCRRRAPSGARQKFDTIVAGPGARPRRYGSSADLVDLPASPRLADERHDSTTFRTNF